MDLFLIFRYFILLLLLLSVNFNQINTQSCDNNDRFGANDPANEDDAIDSNTGFGYMMGHSSWIIDCCGVINKWQANFDNVGGSRTIYFQVWRPTSGNELELVGENAYTTSSDGKQDINIAQADRITVKSGDRWGWWTSGDDIITYDIGPGDNNNIDDNYMMSMGDPAMGDVVDWGSSPVNDRSYGVRVETRDNSNPDFSNLPAGSSTTILNTVASGTNLYTVIPTDDDTYDVSTLTVAMTANSLFSFDTVTNILTTGQDLLGLATQTVSLSFTVTDQCSNTRTRTYDVTITNEPPTINNLPSTASISEDATTETLLHTMSVTDTVGDTVVCRKASSVPASYPFTVKLIPTTTDYGIYSDATPGFDHGAQSSFDLTIECTDGSNTVSGTFTVTLIKNAAPTFLNLQNSTVISTTDSIGSTVFTVLTSDPEGDDLTYSAACIPNTGTCPFTIFASGEIRLNADLSGSTVVGYDLSITVSDYRNTVGPSTLTVTVADINDPVVLSNLPLSSAITVFENTALGSTVFTASYSDIDVSQSHVFTMTSSTSSALTYFTIDSTTGAITTVNSVLNYEALAVKTFTFSVSVADPVTSDTQSLVIDVSNVNEAPSFSQTSYSLSTSEGVAETIIGTPMFGISDPDSGDTAELTLSMDCGTYTSYFLMDSSSGEVSYQSNYDIDTGSLTTSVTCSVIVTDTGSLTDSATLTINIADENDNTPVFAPTSYTFYLSYYANVGTTVGIVTATDADAGVYGSINFILDQAVLGTEIFSVSNVGVIVVKNDFRKGGLNYSSSVSVTMTAVDTGGQTDIASVLIIISGTTTISTTTTTDRYRTFFEDNKNVAWFVASTVILLAILASAIYVTVTCNGKSGCQQFSNKLCKKARRRHRQNRTYELSDLSDTYTPRSHSNLSYPQHGPHSVRQPPPPRGHHSWQAGP